MCAARQMSLAQPPAEEAAESTARVQGESGACASCGASAGDAWADRRDVLTAM